MDAATISLGVGALALIGTASTAATFWMRIGKTEEKAAAARESVAVCHGKIDLLNTALSDYKERAAEKFASGHDIIAAENRFASAVNSMGSRFDAMADRLDRVLEHITKG